jgi:hypothetical protein
MMNEFKEAEERLAIGRASGRTDEEWPLGKSFETKPRAEENLRSIAGTMKE